MGAGISATCGSWDDDEARLEEYCWPDTMRSFTRGLHEEAAAARTGRMTPGQFLVGTIVVSRFCGPGGVVRYVVGESTI